MALISNRLIRSLAAAALMASVTGCCGWGHSSSGDRSADTQGAYLNAMFADIDASTLGQRRPFTPPASLAVAQVGEVSPPAVMLKRLREHGDLFRRVEAIPATNNSDAWRYQRAGGDANAGVRGQVNTLRNMAASIGMDYLLLVGGTVDQSDSATNLSAFNLTIIGAFVVPSHETRMLMKASGALIDVRTGQVVSISSAEADDKTLATLASADRDTTAMLGALREKVTVALADAVATDCVRVGDPTPITISNLTPPISIANAPSSSSPMSASPKTFTIPADPAFASTPDRRFQGR